MYLVVMVVVVVVVVVVVLQVGCEGRASLGTLIMNPLAIN